MLLPIWNNVLHNELNINKRSSNHGTSDGSIEHVRDINILSWLRGFQDKLLYLVFVSLYPSLLGIERQKKLEKFDAKASEPG